MLREVILAGTIPCLWQTLAYSHQGPYFLITLNSGPQSSLDDELESEEEEEDDEEELELDDDEEEVEEVHPLLLREDKAEPDFPFPPVFAEVAKAKIVAIKVEAKMEYFICVLKNVGDSRLLYFLYLPSEIIRDYYLLDIFD